MWFLTGIFLVRHSIELGLKALLCRVLSRKRDIEDAFEECCHDISELYKKYSDMGFEKYLSNDEEEWLIKYLDFPLFLTLSIKSNPLPTIQPTVELSK